MVKAFRILAPTTITIALFIGTGAFANNPETKDPAPATTPAETPASPEAAAPETHAPSDPVSEINDTTDGEIAEGALKTSTSDLIKKLSGDLSKFTKCPSKRSLKGGVPNPKVEMAELGPVFQNLRRQLLSAKISKFDNRQLVEDFSSNYYKVVESYQDKITKNTPEKIEAFKEMTFSLNNLAGINMRAVALCDGFGDPKINFLSEYLKKCLEPEEGKEKPVVTDKMLETKKILIDEWTSTWDRYQKSFKILYAGYNSTDRKELCGDVKAELYEDAQKVARVKHLDEAEAKDLTKKNMDAQKADKIASLLTGKKKDAKFAAAFTEAGLIPELSAETEEARKQIAEKISTNPEFLGKAREILKTTRDPAAATNGNPSTPGAIPSGPGVEGGVRTKGVAQPSSTNPSAPQANAIEDAPLSESNHVRVVPQTDGKIMYERNFIPQMVVPESDKVLYGSIKDDKERHHPQETDATGAPYARRLLEHPNYVKCTDNDGKVWFVNIRDNDAGYITCKGRTYAIPPGPPTDPKEFEKKTSLQPVVAKSEEAFIAKMHQGGVKTPPKFNRAQAPYNAAEPRTFTYAQRLNENENFITCVDAKGVTRYMDVSRYNAGDYVRCGDSQSNIKFYVIPPK